MTSTSEAALITSSKFLGVDKDELHDALVSRVMTSGKGGMKGTIIK